MPATSTVLVDVVPPIFLANQSAVNLTATVHGASGSCDCTATTMENTTLKLVLLQGCSFPAATSVKFNIFSGLDPTASESLSNLSVSFTYWTPATVTTSLANLPFLALRFTPGILLDAGSSVLVSATPAAVFDAGLKSLDLVTTLESGETCHCDASTFDNSTLLVALTNCSFPANKTVTLNITSGLGAVSGTIYVTYYYWTTITTSSGSSTSSSSSSSSSSSTTTSSTASSFRTLEFTLEEDLLGADGANFTVSNSPPNVILPTSGAFITTKDADCPCAVSFSSSRKVLTVTPSCNLYAGTTLALNLTGLERGGGRMAVKWELKYSTYTHTFQSGSSFVTDSLAGSGHAALTFALADRLAGANGASLAVASVPDVVLSGSAVSIVAGGVVYVASSWVTVDLMTVFLPANCTLENGTQVTLNITGLDKKANQMALKWTIQYTSITTTITGGSTITTDSAASSVQLTLTLIDDVFGNHSDYFTVSNSSGMITAFTACSIVTADGVCESRTEPAKGVKGLEGAVNVIPSRRCNLANGTQVTLNLTRLSNRLTSTTKWTVLYTSVTADFQANGQVLSTDTAPSSASMAFMLRDNVTTFKVACSPNVFTPTTVITITTSNGTCTFKPAPTGSSFTVTPPTSCGLTSGANVSLVLGKLKASTTAVTWTFSYSTFTTTVKGNNITTVDTAPGSASLRFILMDDVSSLKVAVAPGVFTTSTTVLIATSTGSCTFKPTIAGNSFTLAPPKSCGLADGEDISMIVTKLKAANVTVTWTISYTKFVTTIQGDNVTTVDAAPGAATLNFTLVADVAGSTGGWFAVSCAPNVLTARTIVTVTANGKACDASAKLDANRGVLVVSLGKKCNLANGTAVTLDLESLAEGASDTTAWKVMYATITTTIVGDNTTEFDSAAGSRMLNFTLMDTVDSGDVIVLSVSSTVVLNVTTVKLTTATGTVCTVDVTGYTASTLTLKFKGGCALTNGTAVWLLISRLSSAADDVDTWTVAYSVFTVTLRGGSANYTNTATGYAEFSFTLLEGLASGKQIMLFASSSIILEVTTVTAVFSGVGVGVCKPTTSFPSSRFPLGYLLVKPNCNLPSGTTVTLYVSRLYWTMWSMEVTWSVKYSSITTSFNGNWTAETTNAAMGTVTLTFVLASRVAGGDVFRVTSAPDVLVSDLSTGTVTYGANNQSCAITVDTAWSTMNLRVQSSCSMPQGTEVTLRLAKLNNTVNENTTWTVMYSTYTVVVKGKSVTTTGWTGAANLSFVLQDDLLGGLSDRVWVTAPPYVFLNNSYGWIYMEGVASACAGGMVTGPYAWNNQLSGNVVTFILKSFCNPTMGTTMTINFTALNSSAYRDANFTIRYSMFTASITTGANASVTTRSDLDDFVESGMSFTTSYVDLSFVFRKKCQNSFKVTADVDVFQPNLPNVTVELEASAGAECSIAASTKEDNVLVVQLLGGCNLDANTNFTLRIRSGLNTTADTAVWTLTCGSEELEIAADLQEATQIACEDATVQNQFKVAPPIGDANVTCMSIRVISNMEVKSGMNGTLIARPAGFFLANQSSVAVRCKIRTKSCPCTASSNASGAVSVVFGCTFWSKNSLIITVLSGLSVNPPAGQRVVVDVYLPWGGMQKVTGHQSLRMTNGTEERDDVVNRTEADLDHPIVPSTTTPGANLTSLSWQFTSTGAVEAGGSFQVNVNPVSVFKTGNGTAKVTITNNTEAVNSTQRNCRANTSATDDGMMGVTLQHNCSIDEGDDVVITIKDNSTLNVNPSGNNTSVIITVLKNDTVIGQDGYKTVNTTNTTTVITTKDTGSCDAVVSTKYAEYRLLDYGKYGLCSIDEAMFGLDSYKCRVESYDCALIVCEVPMPSYVIDGITKKCAI